MENTQQPIPLRIRQYLRDAVGRMHPSVSFVSCIGVLPAPFIIPLFADTGEDGAYISTTLSVGTLMTVVFFIGIAAYSAA